MNDKELPLASEIIDHLFTITDRDCVIISDDEEARFGDIHIILPSIYTLSLAIIANNSNWKFVRIHKTGCEFSRSVRIDL